MHKLSETCQSYVNHGLKRTIHRKTSEVCKSFLNIKYELEILDSVYYNPRDRGEGVVATLTNVISLRGCLKVQELISRIIVEKKWANDHHLWNKELQWQ